MDLSTKVNIALTISSFVLAAISVITVIITLRQNKKMIIQNSKALEASIRPYISIYLDSITICEQNNFFVLKNFGNSSALITKFTYDEVLKTTVQEHNSLNKQFDYIENIVLAPGQSKIMHYNVSTLPVDELTFTIGYKCLDKYYEEATTLNVKNYVHIPVPRPGSHISEGSERQVQTLREIVERLI